MISLFFPNPKTKKYFPPATYKKPSYPNYNTSIDTTKEITPAGGTLLGFYVAEAAKLNITTSEYQRRDEIVRQLSNDCTFRCGDTFYPCMKDGYDRYGKCIVTLKALTYNEISRDEWDMKNNNPMIITARSLEHKDDKGQHKVFICNTSYLSKEVPIG